MRKLGKQQKAVVEAVARRFSASRERGRSAAGASIRFAGKRIGVAVATLAPRDAGRGKRRLGLRFDKVAIELLARLRVAYDKTVPEGMTVALTVTAPIRQSGKTAAALARKIPALLVRKSGRDKRISLHGNSIRIRILKHKSTRAPKMLGFVHNPDTDPRLLLDMADEALALVGRRTVKPEGERWLVLAGAEDSSCPEAYRALYAQLREAAGFGKIFLVSGDGRVELLAG